MIKNTFRQYSAADEYDLRARISVSELLGRGDVAHWWCTHITQTMPTAVIQGCSPMPLEESPRSDIWEIEAETHVGQLSLSDFLQHPDSGARGYVAVQAGRVVAEAYPDLRPQDTHLWASCAKPTVGLIIELLIEEGLIDDSRTFGDYMPEFSVTDWAAVRIIDAMDMTTGMDCEENDETRSDPSSIAIRAFLAEFDEAYGDRVETLRDVLKSSRQIDKPGNKFEYGSPTTQMLVLLAEAVTNCKLAELFEQRVWGHLGTEGPLLQHLSPDGIALAHGVTSGRLRDLARFGMLFTPSWQKVAEKQIVTDRILERIRNPIRSKEFYMRGFDGPVFQDHLGDDTILSNSRQWDAIWEDGDMYKSGFMAQGLYVSPGRDLVICYFSTTPEMYMARYLRPVAGLFPLKDNRS